MTAWHPRVPGVAEALHARFTDHAYPPHSHDSWTLLIVDSGTVRYELGRAERTTTTTSVTLLPPDVSHDGRAATDEGFHKRVLYLERDLMGADLIGRAVDRPTIIDDALHERVARMHDALATRTDDLEAESRLAFGPSGCGSTCAWQVPFPRASGAPASRPRCANCSMSALWRG
ncbi:hypothetical protein BH09ACT5_BH09ACT5_12490 [soil metagenome]